MVTQWMDGWMDGWMESTIAVYQIKTFKVKFGFHKIYTIPNWKVGGGDKERDPLLHFRIPNDVLG